MENEIRDRVRNILALYVFPECVNECADHVFAALTAPADGCDRPPFDGQLHLNADGCECRHHDAGVYVSDCPMLVRPGEVSLGKKCPDKPCTITEPTKGGSK